MKPNPPGYREGGSFFTKNGKRVKVDGILDEPNPAQTPTATAEKPAKKEK